MADNGGAAFLIVLLAVCATLLALGYLVVLQPLLESIDLT
jgi:type II secretory pathway component PulM